MDVKIEEENSDEFDFWMPNLDQDVKTESAEPDLKVEVKEEPVFKEPLPPPPRKSCPVRICHESFHSSHGLHQHLKQVHPEPKCWECDLKLSSWMELDKHKPFCPRRCGLKMGRKEPPKERQQKKPYACGLCRRKYESQKKLRMHQIHNCDKRYVTDSWVVEI